MKSWTNRAGSEEHYRNSKGHYLGSVWKEDFFFTAHVPGRENKGWFWTKRGLKPGSRG